MNYVLMSALHVEQIAKLEAECFSAPWSAKSISDELANPLSLWLVALDGDTVSGYVGSQSVLGEADMMNLAVGEAYRRLGIGKKLVLELISRLKSKDVHCLTLEVRASNNAAISLYRNLGFTQIGCRPNYYAKPKEDALILRKEWEV